MLQIVMKCNVFRDGKDGTVWPSGDEFQNFHIDFQHTNLTEPGYAFWGHNFSSTREARSLSPSPRVRGTHFHTLQEAKEGTLSGSRGSLLPHPLPFPGQPASIPSLLVLSLLAILI